MDTPIYSNGKVRKFCFRFHPNTANDVDPTDTTYCQGPGRMEVASIVYSATGIHTITLKNRHSYILGVVAKLHIATAPGPSPVEAYGTAEGMSAANSFALISYVNGTATAVTYATTSWIFVEVTVMENAEAP